MYVTLLYFTLLRVRKYLKRRWHIAVKCFLFHIPLTLLHARRFY